MHYFIREALVRCGYPHWAINKAQNKYINSHQEDNNNHINNQEENSIQDTQNPSTSTEESTHSMDDNNNSQDTHNPSTITEEAPQSRQNTSIGILVITYTQGIAESCKKIGGKYDRSYIAMLCTCFSYLNVPLS